MCLLSSQWLTTVLDSIPLWWPTVVQKALQTQTHISMDAAIKTETSTTAPACLHLSKPSLNPLRHRGSLLHYLAQMTLRTMVLHWEGWQLWQRLLIFIPGVLAQLSQPCFMFQDGWTTGHYERRSRWAQKDESVDTKNGCAFRGSKERLWSQRGLVLHWPSLCSSEL